MCETLHQNSHKLYEMRIMKKTEEIIPTVRDLSHSTEYV